MPIKLTKKSLDSLNKELGWRFSLSEQESQTIVENLVNYLDFLEDLLKLPNIEPIAQKLLKLIYEKYFSK